MKQKFCTHCGKALQEKEKFCSRCGTAVKGKMNGQGPGQGQADGPAHGAGRGQAKGPGQPGGQAQSRGQAKVNGQGQPGDPAQPQGQAQSNRQGQASSPAQPNRQAQAAGQGPKRPAQASANAGRRSGGQLPPSRKSKKTRKAPWIILALGILVLLVSLFVFFRPGGHEDKVYEEAASSQSMESQAESSEASSSSSEDKPKKTQVPAQESKQESEKKEEKAQFGSASSHQAADLTESQAKSVNDAFFDWAVGRAKTAKMAVSRNYFDHGAAGRGDWYACTVDGPVLVQDLNNPGDGSHYVGKAVGGCTFYYSKNGVVGDAASDDASVPSADAISGVTKPGTEAHRYLLCDNGKVYELIGKVGRTTGYNQAKDDGSGLPPVGQEVRDPSGQVFIVSEDADAQAEFQKLLSQYH